MKLDDLLDLLVTHSLFPEVACFAWDLEPPDLGRPVMWLADGRCVVGPFAWKDGWYCLRVEEKLGIVVVYRPSAKEVEQHPAATQESTQPLHEALKCAATQSEPPARRDVAILRDPSTNHNLVIDFSMSHGGWVVLPSDDPFFKVIKRMLWADVPETCGRCGKTGDVVDHLCPACWAVEHPKCLLSNCRWNTWGYCYAAVGSDCTPHAAACTSYERQRDVAAASVESKQTDKLTLRPFPGADAHPDKRGGELCVEGTDVPVARVLEEFTMGETVLVGDLSSPRTAMRLAEAMGLDYIKVRDCLRGLADWLKTRSWTATDAFQSTICRQCGLSAPSSAETGLCDACRKGTEHTCDNCGYEKWCVENGQACDNCDDWESKEDRDRFRRGEPPEKRCGTCDFGQDYTCNHLRVSTKVTMRNGSDDGGYLTEDNGPPWPDCRFWKPRRT